MQGLLIVAAAGLCLGVSAGADYSLPSGCPDPEICTRIRIVCDSRATAQCSDGYISPRGIGPECCCPVCYRNEGARCNNDYRICRPDLECRQGRCRPRSNY